MSLRDDVSEDIETFLRFKYGDRVHYQEVAGAAGYWLVESETDPDQVVAVEVGWETTA